MRKQIITLALVLMAMFATNLYAQNNASELIEKYREIPKSEFHHLKKGVKLLKNINKTEISEHDYELLKKIEVADILVVSPNAAQRTAILGDLKSLKGFKLINSDSAKFIANEDAQYTININGEVEKLVNGNIFGKVKGNYLTEMVFHLNFFDKTILVHIVGKLPKSETDNLIRLMIASK